MIFVFSYSNQTGYQERWKEGFEECKKLSLGVDFLLIAVFILEG
jgi:hypothetical protein